MEIVKKWDEEIKRLIIEGAKEFDVLGDWCILVEYDPDIGRIPPRWEPRYDVFHAASYVVRNLYNPVQQRTWVGLTMEDKQEFVNQDFGGNRLDAMDWAEAKLKEKNNG